MRKTKICLIALLIVIIVLAGGYFMFLKGTLEASISGVPDKAEQEYEKRMHKQVVDKLGIPDEPGMEWDTTKTDMINALEKSGVDFSELKVYQISDHTDQNYVDEMKESLNLSADSQEIYLSPGNGFYFEDLNNDCEMTERKMEAIGRERHLGVWQGSTNYGTTKVQSDQKTGTETFTFDGLPWKQDMYGNSLGTDGILYGIESNQSIFWQIEGGNLKKFAGFSYEITPQKIKNDVSTKQRIGDFIWDVVERYVACTNQEEKMVGEDVAARYVRFIPEEITISMTREIFEEKSNQFVPIIEFNGTVYNYDFEAKQWDYYQGGYAVSLESGDIYDWRKQK